jgi:hypothetical protein
MLHYKQFNKNPFTLAGFLCLVMLSLSIGKANAQIKANSLLLGGSLSFDHTNGTNSLNKNGTETKQDEPSITLFGIEPRAGYFVADNTCLGLSMDFRLTSTTQLNTAGKSTTYTNTSMLFGPFGRYYVGLSDKVYAFGELSFAGGIDGQNINDPVSNDLTNITVTNLQAGVGPGLNFFINDFVAFEALAKYNYSNRTFTAFGDKNVTNTNNFRFTVGLQIYLRTMSASINN